jgi:type I restriction enzyme, S subunit
MANTWIKKRLESLATVQTGIAKGKKGIQDPVDLPYLRVANVQDGHLDLREIKKITIPKKLIERYLLKVGDVLLTEGGDFDKLGRGTIWRGQIEFCLHQNHIFVVRPDPLVLIPEFFSYQASSPYGKKYFLSCSKQTTNLASINSTQLKHFPVLFPSLPEQKKIVEILEIWDEAIALTEKAITAKQKLKKSFSNKFFGIHCPKEKIGKLADVKTGGTPSRNEESYWLDGKIPWMSSGEINNRYVNKTKEFITDDGFKNSNATLLPKGSVMIALNGQGRTRGSVALLEIETTCNQSLAAIIPNTKTLNNEFLFFYLESIYQEIRQLTGDEVRNGLNLKLIREIKVPIPDLAFQKEGEHLKDVKTVKKRVAH